MREYIEIERTFTRGFHQRMEQVEFLLNDDYESLELIPQLYGDGVIDLGLSDTRGFRGWGCSLEHKKRHFTSKERASYGYLPGEIKKGRWALVIGVINIVDEKVVLKVKVELTRRHRRYVLGDTHSHSLHSDGNYRMHEKLDNAVEQGLDFIICTDHNTLSQNSSTIVNDKVLMIPGVEFTTYFGHANIVGLKRPLETLYWEKREDLISRLKEAKERGASVGLNHPVSDPDCIGCTWRWGFDAIPYDWIEVWNGHWSENNEKSLALWHKKLCDGERVAAVSGSDVHHKKRAGGGEAALQHGTPCLNVSVEELTCEEVLKAMREGRSYMTKGPKAPKLEFYTKKGDSLPSDTFIIELKELSGRERLHIISDIRHETVAVNRGEFRKEVKSQGDKFLRVELREGMSVTLLSNPIYP